MSADRDLARLALSLVEGAVRGDSEADDLLAEGLGDLGEAARAHAYLAGFVIEILAESRQETTAQTCSQRLGARGLLVCGTHFSRWSWPGETRRMTEWRTAAELLSAKAALVDSMPGWTTPLAYALGVVDVSGEIDWRVTNYRSEHELPGVVLGKVLGYRSGSTSYTVDLRTFDEAIAALEPAGACDAFEHPNLWAWQRLRDEISAGAVPEESQIVVVFLGSSSEATGDRRVATLQRHLGLD